MLRIKPEVLLHTLVRHGIEQGVAAAELGAAASHPYVIDGDHIVQLKEKLESILKVHRDFAALVRTPMPPSSRERRSRP